MNEYLARDGDGYLCMNSLRALIVAWLDSSQRSPVGVRLNRFAWELSEKGLDRC